MNDLVANLNPEQSEAVLHPSGPLLVVAGAGSGKTRVLTHRVAHLIQNLQISPFSILAITFTNKAAHEMVDRLEGLVGPTARKMWVSTFHSACVRMLRRDAERLGYKSGFTIYDQGDSLRLIKLIVKEKNLDPKKHAPKAIQALISSAKNSMIDCVQYEQNAMEYFERTVSEIYTEYQKRLRGANAMDFDDLLGETVRLLQNHPDVLEHYQSKFQYILVDEYQDTNKVQNAMVLLLANAHHNVTVVGDQDQSIYAFRMADMQNIIDFESAFPDTKVIMLEQNYRSTQRILDAANALIANNTERRPKRLFSNLNEGELIDRYVALDEQDEARFVASEMTRLHDEEHYKWSDFAIMYRTNSQSRSIEEQLSRAGVPYRVVGGTRFYDRREVRDLLAYLRVLVNRDDEVSLRRVINIPKRGVGDASLAKIELWASANGVSFYEGLRNASEAGVGGQAGRGIAAFLELLDSLWPDEDEMQFERPTPGEILQVLLQETGYLRDLESENTIESQGRVENLFELVGNAKEFETLEGFLEAVSLVADSDQLKEDTTEAVLMTIHTAKGLEFPVVFVVGMEEGLFPHQRTLTEPAEIEEERRLAYVSVTRARERLFLTNAWSRNLWGGSQAFPPSRFLEEIPAELVRIRESEWSGRGGSAPRHRASRYESDASYEGTRSFGRGGGSTRYDDGVQDERAYGAASTSTLRKPAFAWRAEPEAVEEELDEIPRLELNLGDTVSHIKWGKGRVLQVLGEGKSTEVIVRFGTVGEKRLLIDLAPISKCESRCEQS